MTSNSLEIRPIAGTLGAEIAGVDLCQDLDGGAIAAIRRAWLDHLVIFFRGQALPPERFLAVARCYAWFTEGFDTPDLKMRRRCSTISINHLDRRAQPRVESRA